MPHDSDYGSSGNYKASIGQILSNFNPLEFRAAGEVHAQDPAGAVP